LVSNLLEDLPCEFHALYADDMVIGIEPWAHRIQTCLRIIESRAKHLGIDFDAKKTKIMAVRQGNRAVSNFPIVFKDKLLEYTNSYKYLGIIIDSRLTFGEAIKTKILKSRQRIQIINRFSMFNSSIRRALYLGFVQSYLFYCLKPIWSHLSASWKQKIHAVVRMGARMICGFTQWAYDPSPFAGIREDPTQPAPRKPKFLISRLHRVKEVRMLRLFHGSGWCLARKKSMKIVESDVCLRCSEGVSESVSHILFSCPALSCSERSRISHDFGENTESWKNLSRVKLIRLSSLLDSFATRWDVHF
jgi:hypothetical protein